MADRTPLNELEKGILAKLSYARFPPATASKRFVRDLDAGFVKELSPKGRSFLAYIAYKFRRQYSLTAEETVWVNEWMACRWWLVLKDKKPPKIALPIVPQDNQPSLFEVER